VQLSGYYAAGMQQDFWATPARHTIVFG